MGVIFLDKGYNLSYNMDKRLSSESADKLRSLAYLRRSEAFCLKGKDEMNSQKPFKTYNQQLKILRSRNIEINDGSKAIRILKREGYYNIVNGYKEIFLDTALTASKGNDWYKPGTKFDYLYALYDFDRSLKRCLLGYILKMETFQF